MKEKLALGPWLVQGFTLLLAVCKRHRRPLKFEMIVQEINYFLGGKRIKLLLAGFPFTRQISSQRR